MRQVSEVGKTYYFISYADPYATKKKFNSALIHEHPLQWQCNNPDETLINWKEISQAEYEQYSEYIVFF